MGKIQCSSAAFAIVATLGVASCSRYVTKPDQVPPFPVDSSKPFRLEFGRGSGWRGLAVVIVEETGATTVSRKPIKNGDEWTYTTLNLKPSEIAEIAAAINSERLTSLDRVYSQKGVQDGTQWVLLITQGANRKAVYFDNHFPAEIKRFADSLDAILHRAGLTGATWIPLDRQLDKTLWDSVK